MPNIDKSKLYKKEKKKLSTAYGITNEDRKIKCPVCGKEIKEEGLDSVEYVKTKRGTEIFVHTGCVHMWRN